MLEPIFSPLNYYLHTAKDKHSGYTREYLRLLSDAAQVDRAANAQTVSALHSKEAHLQSLRKDASGKKTLKTALITIMVVAYFILAIFCLDSMTIDDVAKCLILLGGLGLMIFGIVFTCKKFNAKLRALDSQISTQQAEVNELRRTAWQQAFPLNNLFKDDDSLQLFTKTLPFIPFDECFTDSRLNELVHDYGFYAGIGEEDTILDTLSGELYGSPFVYVKSLSHRLGTKTYTGSLTISWTTTERDSQGKLVTRHHTQTLHASIVRPAPYYHADTTLYFGNAEVPNVNFSRTYAHAEDKSDAAIAKTVRRGQKKIKKLEEKALKTGDDFQGVTNTEFDVLFGATNRTDDLEFLQMFTPRAQESMLELLLYKDGYGDDFSFTKHGKICAIHSEHSQGKSLFPTASDYYSYDITAVENAFISQNETFFRSVYFDFAPLLLIPPYQQPLVRSEPLAYGNLTAYNFEAIANKLSSQLEPDGARTASIFKTSLTERSNGVDTVQVCADAYYTENRVHYESVYGGDGCWHSVPVYWTEYLPISRTSFIRITKGKKEDCPDGGVQYRGYYAYKA